MDAALDVHRKARSGHGMPQTPPKSEGGIPCPLCSNACIMGPGQSGFCGLRSNLNGTPSGFWGTERALLHAYLDAHPTNCCSNWFCPGGTGSGYPRFSRTRGPEYGYSNLSIFMYGCGFDCLFCQNWQHKQFDLNTPGTPWSELVQWTLRDPNISCWCFFGGSPEPQLPFSLKASREVLSRTNGRVMRICFEWNGCGNQQLVRKAAELSLRSGGNLKFDLKCWTPELSLCLSGVDNKRAFENFRLVGTEFFDGNSDVPVLTATTLLVPGYVDHNEVRSIAKFIAEIDDRIPYSLLIFHPDYKMRDLPITPRSQLEACWKEAKSLLKRVHIGNLHLLSWA